MKVKQEKILKLIEDLDFLIKEVKNQELLSAPMLDSVCPDYFRSARNLIHYTAFRSYDIRNIQRKLGILGISRLARAEGHVSASLLNTKFILQKLLGEVGTESGKSGLSIKKAEKRLTKNTKALLGYRSKGRRVRIMVTLPTEAANDYNMVKEMVANGMNCARINCAHDGPEVWEKIIANVKKASHKKKRKIKITMDLAGPKIRTGAIKPGPRVRKFSPQRDEYGIVTNPAKVFFTSNLTNETPPDYIQVPESWMENLIAGDKITFTDTRDKQRTLQVMENNHQQVMLACPDTSYIGIETILTPQRTDLEPEKAGVNSTLEQAILLKAGDYITIHKDATQGEPAIMDNNGEMLTTGHIGCSLPEIINMVKIGEEIYFDDGKIGGVITEVFDDKFIVCINRAKGTGSKLRADKGINLPHSDIQVSGLTEKDKEDLKFIVQHADVINYSFVNTPKDVNDLLQELSKLDALGKIGIILKIETIKAFNNLQWILLTAMQTNHIGVMIARGDLAIEAGWENIGRIQREIVEFCGAAHIPVVWATQVLENLAKKGLPSRAEITDTLNAMKSECVMLNKGLYINQAIKLLDIILKDMENYQAKNTAMLPQLQRLG